MTALGRAISILGSKAALARKVGVTRAAVQKWRRFDRIPATRVLAIERATVGRVTRADLRPDLYGVKMADNQITADERFADLERRISEIEHALSEILRRLDRPEKRAQKNAQRQGRLT